MERGDGHPTVMTPSPCLWNAVFITPGSVDAHVLVLPAQDSFPLLLAVSL